MADSESNSLHIYLSCDEQGLDTFVLEQELSTISSNTYDKMYNILDMDEVTEGLPNILYRMSRWPLIYPPRHEEALIYLIPLSDRLRKHINHSEYDTIVCHELPEQYLPVVDDVASTTGVTIEHEGENPGSYHHSIVSLLWSLISVVPFYFDLLFSWMLSRLFMPPTNIKTVVVPSISRFESIEPVLRELNSPHVILSSVTVTWLLSRNRYPGVAAYEPVPVNRYVTVKAFLSSIYIWLNIGVEILFSRSLDDALRTHIADKCEIECPNTVTYALNQAYGPRRLVNALKLPVYEAAFDSMQCRNVVSSLGAGSGSHAVWIAGNQCSLQTYYLPHSISLAYPKPYPAGTEKFVAGNLAVRAERQRGRSTSGLVPLGRPYLTELYASKDEYISPIQSGGSIRIVIGTEPLSDEIRSDFVNSILAAIAESSLEFDADIKIHPDEDPGFYESLRPNQPVQFNIVESDLFHCLGDADIVITMASNIGLEAIVLEAVNVCVTLWEPFVRPLPYAKYGPVPTFRKSANLLTFFSQVSRDDIENLKHDQQEFLHQEFTVKTDAAREIADYIEKPQHRNNSGKSLLDDSDVR